MYITEPISTRYLDIIGCSSSLLIKSFHITVINVHVMMKLLRKTHQYYKINNLFCLHGILLRFSILSMTLTKLHSLLGKSYSVGFKY